MSAKKEVEEICANGMRQFGLSPLPFPFSSTWKMGRYISAELACLANFTLHIAFHVNDEDVDAMNTHTDADAVTDTDMESSPTENQVF